MGGMGGLAQSPGTAICAGGFRCGGCVVKGQDHACRRVRDGKAGQLLLPDPGEGGQNFMVKLTRAVRPGAAWGVAESGSI